MRLGELLIKDGVINDWQLNNALDIQKDKEDLKLAEILLSLGYIDTERFTHIADEINKSK